MIEFLTSFLIEDKTNRKHNNRVRWGGDDDVNFHPFVLSSEMLRGNGDDNIIIGTVTSARREDLIVIGKVIYSRL